MVKRLVYKIFTDCVEIRQATTTVNVENAPFFDSIYDYATRVLHDRFPDYGMKINHAGKTVKLYPIGGYKE